jgi:hypothetical protein
MELPVCCRSAVAKLSTLPARDRWSCRAKRLGMFEACSLPRGGCELVGVVWCSDPTIEADLLVWRRVLEAAEASRLGRLGAMVCLWLFPMGGARRSIAGRLGGNVSKT